MGDVSADSHPVVVFELFWHKINLSSRGISYQARYSCSAKKPVTSELCHLVNVLSPRGYDSVIRRMNILVCSGIDFMCAYSTFALTLEDK